MSDSDSQVLETRKPKRVRTEAQLEALAKARILANKKRRENAELVKRRQMPKPNETLSERRSKISTTGLCRKSKRPLPKTQKGLTLHL